VTLTQIDFSDMIPRNAALSRDRSHEIANLDAVAGADGHEEARHPSGAASRTVRIARFCPRNGGLIRFGHAALRSLALEYMECSGCELSSVELPEEWLQRNHFARWNSPRQYCAQLLSQPFFAVMSSSFRALKIERG